MLFSLIPPLLCRHCSRHASPTPSSTGGGGDGGCSSSRHGSRAQTHKEPRARHFVLSPVPPSPGAVSRPVSFPPPWCHHDCRTFASPSLPLPTTHRLSTPLCTADPPPSLVACRRSTECLPACLPAPRPVHFVVPVLWCCLHCARHHRTGAGAGRRAGMHQNKANVCVCVCE